MNMEKTYLCISITTYPTLHLAPDIHYYKDDGKSVTSAWNKLTVEEATKLMYELVKLGGTYRYRVNPYNRGIHTREVTFCGVL